MGLGKTRVLVPMIILDCMSSGTVVGRVNVLPSIFGEALQHYRKVLVASVHNVKLFTQPFNRDCRFDDSIAQLLVDELQRCRLFNGAFMVTPQHRLSLLLKQHEQNVIFAEGTESCFLDILDESDAILSHEFQLVYALGNQQDLPHGQSRWKVLNALLLLLSRSSATDIVSIVNDGKLTYREKAHNGSFPKTRFLSSIQGHEQRLGKALCRQLLSDPPYELGWMRHVNPSDKALLTRIMSDPTYETSVKSIGANSLFENNQGDILAARGLVAYGTLFHGLEARYRVNYGLLPKTVVKLAVPYSASDTPKPRTQYSHPDICLVYTALSYLHEGLTVDQLKEALLDLQTQLGPEAQNKIYSGFVDAIRTDTNPEIICCFDNLSKVDVMNKAQFDLIYDSMKHCMEVICFWTEKFVFPTETKQFSSKLATNAWHLCETNTIGFSGTDDNRFLLPPFVAQITPEEEHLRATNGEMISLILQATKEVTIVPESFDIPLWERVVGKCIDWQVQALIDVSGLMAGEKNCDVAVYVSSKLKKDKLYAVAYFDQDTNNWNVYETKNKRAASMASSNFKPSECFVFFDQSRCRGTDMKLPTTATALVTIEPKLTKDRFLQGCARMRKLKGGQSLVLAGTSEAIKKNTNARQLLETILHYTSDMIKRGVETYFQRGMDYYHFPDPSIDDFTLVNMYGDERSRYPDFAAYFDATMEVSVLSEREIEHAEYCKDLGDNQVDSGLLSGECEQELEHEAEKESQQEIEDRREMPSQQTDWNYEKAFTEPHALISTEVFISLRSFIARKLPKLAPISWEENIFCSPNFCTTIKEGTNVCSDLARFARHVSALLVTHDGKVVLLSLYDMDKLLPLWWKIRNESSLTFPRATLRHLFLADSHVGLGFDNEELPQNLLASLKLFCGYVGFSPDQIGHVQTAFRNIKEPRSTALALLHMRNRLSYYDRSDLELATTVPLDPNNKHTNLKFHRMLEMFGLTIE